MINDAVLSRFTPFVNGLLKPIYADYSFANIPNTLEYLLTGKQRGPLLPKDCFGGAYPAPQKIVLFFIDAFAWEYWRRFHSRYRTTRAVVERGVLTPISALFPSTTAASVATLNLGVLPAEHAFYEWNIYVPAYGEVIKSLPFAPLGVDEIDACFAKGYNPRDLLAVHETLHQRLNRHGVRSLHFAHRSYASGASFRQMAAGSELARHTTLAESLVQLKHAVQQVDGKALFNIYWGGIDGMGHIYGPATDFYDAEIASYWRAFDDIFSGIDSPDTLYLFAADHGVMQAKNTYLNERLPKLAEHLAVSPTGHTIYPTGSPRDVFLHVKPDLREETLALLHQHFDDMALIMPMNEAVEAGLFGPADSVGAELRRRLGDILILPDAGHFLWWHEPGMLKNICNGHHGGLTPDELITVFGVIDAL